MPWRNARSADMDWSIGMPPRNVRSAHVGLYVYAAGGIAEHANMHDHQLLNWDCQPVTRMNDFGRCRLLSWNCQPVTLWRNKLLERPLSCIQRICESCAMLKRLVQDTIKMCDANSILAIWAPQQLPTAQHGRYNSATKVANPE